MPHLFSQTPGLTGGLCKQPDLKKVLLVENNLEDAYSINWLLTQIEAPTFELVHVGCLNEALRWLKQEYFDVVLVNLELPDSQGIDTLLHLRRRCPNIPILTLANVGNAVSMDQAIQQGAQDYLVKEHINQSCLANAIAFAISRTQWNTQQHQQLQQFNQTLRSQIRDCRDEIDHLKKKLQFWSTLALTDGLTGIANRYCFEQYFEQVWLHACRSSTPLSLVMIDLDYFKQFNDSCGHLQGDICLQQVAQFLNNRLDPATLVARYGGEEFIIVLPDTSTVKANKVARDLKWGIRDLAIRHPSSAISSWVTASFGVASVIPTLKLLPSTLIDKADHALYLAKERGRNLIACY